MGLTARIDGGKTWTPFAGTPPVRSLAVANADHAWLLTRAGRILRTTDGGRVWQQMRSGQA